MTNEEKFKNELDWLKANYPLIGDHDFKLDSVVHVTVGRIAELLYEHAFGCGRLGAAVSASPQPRCQCPKCGSFNVTIGYYDSPTRLGVHSATCRVCRTSCDSTGTMWAQFFAAAPAQEPDCERCNAGIPLGKETTSGHFRDGEFVGWCKKSETYREVAAQEQPVENSPQEENS